VRDRRDCREGGALKLLSRADRITWVRSTLGPGPKTALKVGALVGFASGSPTNFGTATWAVILLGRPQSAVTSAAASARSSLGA
jgi:hypothetical protein